MSDWLVRARAAAAAPPLRPREPLFLVCADKPCAVGSIEAEIAGRIVAAGLPLQRSADGWRIGPPPEASLAAIARRLHDEGLAGRWRDELLAVVDKSERPVAAVERSVVRVLGLTTFAVHLVGLDGQGQVWVQQRAFDKATDPGRWDTMMGGQVAAGESIGVTLARETLEEAGLDVASLRDLRRSERITIRRPVAEGYMVEHIEVFAATVLDGTVPVNRDGEVERFECLGRDALVERLRAGAFTLEATLILGAELERGLT